MSSATSENSVSERTFRDPAGYVEVRADAVYRFLQPEAAAELRAFLASPLAGSLVQGGRLVSSEWVRASAETPDLPEGVAVLRHPRLPWISYPWEWCPAQWLAAAELTLSLQRELVAAGWILKDATPLNILFRGPEPVLVDVASVARLDETQPIWFAYSQFVRTFLLPMLAHTRLGWPLRTALLRRDGLEPEELFPHLTWGARLRQPARSAITLPLLLGRLRPRQAAAAAEKATNRPRPHDPELVRHILDRNAAGLLQQMRRAMPAPRSSAWTGYSGTAFHYSEADHAAKRAFVRGALQRAQPKLTLDVGANAGVYSEFAAEAGATVVAVDTDLQTMDRLMAKLQGSGKAILPLVIDLANPTPGAGWRNRETLPFLERAGGAFDCVMMLAVIHHLLLHDHVPMPAIAALAAALTTRTLILEWVPPTDVMFRELVRGRDALFAGITEMAFRESFGEHFHVVAEQALENGRVLFHLQSRSHP